MSFCVLAWQQTQKFKNDNFVIYKGAKSSCLDLARPSMSQVDLIVFGCDQTAGKSVSIQFPRIARADSPHTHVTLFILGHIINPSDRLL